MGQGSDSLVNNKQTHPVGTKEGAQWGLRELLVDFLYRLSWAEQKPLLCPWGKMEFYILPKSTFESMGIAAQISTYEPYISKVFVWVLSEKMLDKLTTFTDRNFPRTEQAWNCSRRAVTTGRHWVWKVTGCTGKGKSARLYFLSFNTHLQFWYSLCLGDCGPKAIGRSSVWQQQGHIWAFCSGRLWDLLMTYHLLKGCHLWFPLDASCCSQ